MKRAIFSPSKYIQGEGELGNLQEYFSNLGEKGAYAILDPFVAENYEDQITKGFKDGNITIHSERFNGECSKNEVNRLVADVKDKGLDVIMGIGGGKTIDTAKAVAYHAELPIIVVPTIASTDAPCSALSVLYTDNGEFDEYLLLKSNPNAVVVDTNIIAKSPARLLVAGIGDAMATYFEARACHLSNASTMAGGQCSLTALALAELCLNTLLEDGLKAKLSVEYGVNSKAVENIIEASTYLSGIGFESGGLAAAHAIHNGMTVLEECHHMYHGEKVAFGTLVQLVLENENEEEILELMDFYRKLGLPTTLEDLGVDKTKTDRIMMFAKASCVEGETIHNMPFEVRAEDVYSAILVTDSLGSLL